MSDSQRQTLPTSADGGGQLPARPDLLVAWPRTAQWAMGFLLAVAVLLIALNALQTTRWGARPTHLEERAALVGRVDINHADPALLAQLPGIGPNLARDIEAYRRSRGSFRRIDDLKNVSGIGDTRFETLRPWVYIGKEETTTGTSRPGKAERLTRLIDVNRAGEEELQQLPGIGPTLARRIIEVRQAAPFRSVEDLRRVRGIGVKTLEKLRPHVTVDGQSKLPDRAA
jgi:competence protein ComEA